MKKVIVMALVAATVAVNFALVVPSAQASSSYNGLFNSNGRSAVSWQNQYRSTNVTNYFSDAQLLQYIRQLQALVAQLQALQGGNYNNNGGYGNGNSEVAVVTRRADAIDDNAGTIRGDVDFNNSDEATVYFDWGTSINNLNNETTNIVLDSSDNDTEFSAYLTNLDEDTTYYYQAVAEDEDGQIDRGNILSFRTDENNGNNNGNGNSNNDDLPDVNTDEADSVTDNSVRLHGMVDMNDFENGYVFFVYGDDENQVDDVSTDFDTYGDVDEDGDSLQKIGVDSNLDDQASYRATVSGLNNDTEIFYALCVAFEDADNDEVILCGDTDSFTTDEN